MNIKELSNAELRLEKENKRNELEAIKAKIRHLEEMKERIRYEQLEIITEMNKRKMI